MGGIFSGPKPPPPPPVNRELEQQLADERAERQRAEDRNDARIRNLRRRGQRRPLLFDSFDGVSDTQPSSSSPSNTLG